VEPVSDTEFCVDDPAFPCPIPFAFSDTFRAELAVEPAFAEFEEHSSANKFDFSRSGQFRFVGDIFVAETGSCPPVTGAEEFTGFRVVRVNRNGKVTDFIRHKKDEADVIFDPAGFNKPIDVKFRNAEMFIVDLGIVEPSFWAATARNGEGLGGDARLRPLNGRC
jgi:hypothetical protein